MANDLTPRQDKLVEYVAMGEEGQAAAIKAGYSPKSAKAQASQQLNNPKLQKAIEERKQYYRSIADVEAKDVIGAYQEMAFASIEDSLNDKGDLDFKKAKKNGSAKLIKKITTQHTKSGVNTIVEFYPRTEALSQLSDILGIKQLPRDNEKDRTKAIEELAAKIADRTGIAVSPELAAQMVSELYGDVPLTSDASN
jgi:hypothetical protein